MRQFYTRLLLGPGARSLVFRRLLKELTLFDVVLASRGEDRHEPAIVHNVLKETTHEFNDAVPCETLRSSHARRRAGRCSDSPAIAREGRSNLARPCGHRSCASRSR